MLTLVFIKFLFSVPHTFHKLGTVILDLLLLYLHFALLAFESLDLIGLKLKQLF